MGKRLVVSRPGLARGVRLRQGTGGQEPAPGDDAGRGHARRAFLHAARPPGQGDVYYTQVKYLRRAKGARKGTVLPTQEKNLHVKLDPERIERAQGRGRSLSRRAGCLPRWPRRRLCLRAVRRRGSPPAFSCDLPPAQLSSAAPRVRVFDRLLQCRVEIDRLLLQRGPEAERLVRVSCFPEVNRLSSGSRNSLSSRA